MEKIYEINYDHNHVSDAGFDAFVNPFVRSDFFIYDLINSEEFKHPNMIYFREDFEVFTKTDYLVTDINAPVFSKKMLNILESIGSFKHKTIPCRITDFTIDIEDSYDDFENCIIKPDIEVNNEFEILHLLELPDLLDWEKSDLIMDDDYPEELLFVKKYSFKEPKGGFPPIFRLKEQLASLFVTE